MKIYIGTTSSLKIKAAEAIFTEFQNKGVLRTKPILIPEKVNEGLPITPKNKETFDFAKKRAQLLFNKNKNDGDYFCGVESGLIGRYGTMFEECWVAIIDKVGKYSYGYSSGLMLPRHIVEKMKKGEKHHEIVNSLSPDQNAAKETWSIYTKGVIIRQKSIEEAFRNAFYYAITS